MKKKVCYHKNMVGKNILYSSAVLVYDQKINKVLGVSRKTDKKLFGFPGGKLNLGETFWEAAIRELKEETGLEATVMSYALDMKHSGEQKDYHCVVFVAEVVGTINTNESGVVGWLEPSVLAYGPFGDLTRAVFNKFNIKYKKTKNV